MAQQGHFHQQQLLDDWRASLNRCGWTDADLKAIAVLRHTRVGDKKEDFREFSDMMSALKYTHQIETITANGITFNNQPPREIYQHDVRWAYRFGEFISRRGEYKDWKTYCSRRYAPLPWAFQAWEFDFERSMMYMRVGQIRADYPEIDAISMTSNLYPRFPLDNFRERAN